MMNQIIKFSLENKFLIILAAVVVMVVGLHTTLNMDVDVFPDLTAPAVVVMTDAHGMAAEEVERLVTFPIETAVNGATDVRRVRSVSAQGFSFVWVEFDWGTDIFKARQIVSEKLNTIAMQMPLGVGMPTLAPQTSVMGEMFFIGMQAERTDLMELRTIAEWNIKPMLLATSGVAQVTIIGGEYKQYQVLADPQKMRYYDVSLGELAEVCQSMSRNSTGGAVRQYGNEYVVRGMARTAEIEALGESFIKLRNGKPVCVQDVAEVKVAGAPKMGHASENGKPAVIISVSKQPNTNTLDLTRRIEANLDVLGKTLPPDVKLDTKIFRQADFIETSIGNVQRALLEGAFFVVIVLFMFLGGFRSTFISLIAMPISLLGSIIVLSRLGLNINTMSLGGMAIAIGSLVDDAIIDVENVYKRLKQNLHKPAGGAAPGLYRRFRGLQGDPRFDPQRHPDHHRRLPAALLPLRHGRPHAQAAGHLLRGLALHLAHRGHDPDALAVQDVPGRRSIPAQNRKREMADAHHCPPITRNRWPGRLRHKSAVIAAAVGLFIVSLVAFSTLGRSFLPEFNEGSLTLSVVCKPGTSLEESNRLGNLVETELLSIPEVTSTARRTGRGELDEHSQTVNSAEIDVNFALRKRPRGAFMSDVRARLAGIPGIASTVGQPLGHRIDHMLSGTRANIAIKIFGDDLNELFRLGNQVQTALTGVAGLVDVAVDQQIEIPQIQIRARRGMLAAHGITIEQFNEFVDIAFGGEKLSDIYEGQMRFDLVLRLNRDYTETMDGIRAALIDTADGRKVPLEQVADVVSVAGPSAISRENVQRKIVVSANVAGRDLRGVIRDIQQRIRDKIALPKGYRVEYGGQFESEARASQTLLLTSILSIADHLSAALPRIQQLQTGGHRPAQPAAGPDRRRILHLFHLRHPEHSGHHRLHHPVRHRHPQRHPAHFQLSADAEPGPPAPRNGDPGLARPAHSHPDDGADGGAGPDPAGHQW